jgi:hypothetical protein
MDNPSESNMVLLSPDDVMVVHYIRAWHEKMIADSKSPGGLVDFHLREQQAHVYLGKVLTMLDV